MKFADNFSSTPNIKLSKNDLVISNKKYMQRLI
jgi:hypothetical protein